MTKIAQISDIHWRGFQRHEEYTKVFENLFDSLKKTKPDIIVCTGDIFHTKTQGITPEVIEKISWMFEELASHADLYVVLGNHDGNLANDSRQDTISPIIKAMNRPSIKLMKDSGNYEGPNNINFGAYSCFDKESWNKVSVIPDKINVALFHGSVLNCIVDNGTTMSHGEVGIEFFDGWDFALLGDIHKTQFLAHRAHDGLTRNLKPWIGYPGSMIQQNFGEDEVKGYFLWDIRSKNDWDVQFLELQNPNPMLTVSWDSSALNTAEALRLRRKAAGKNLAGSKVRLILDKAITAGEIKEFTAIMKDGHAVSEVVIKNDSITKANELISSDSVDIHKASLRHDVKALMVLFDQFLGLNKTKYKLDAKQLEQAEQIMKGYLDKLNLEDVEVARDVLWSVKEMNFDNLYCYGQENKINFQHLNGLVGIFGPNRAGKSSIVGSLMFGLYNTTDRGPAKSAYIINKKKTQAQVEILLNANGADYLIRRKVEKAVTRKGIDDEKAAVSLELYKVNGEDDFIEVTSENSESRPDTDKVIRNLIGSSLDFLYTAFANQGGLNRFIEEGATQRKLILNRFLDLGIFEKLAKYASEDCNRLSVKTEDMGNTQWESTMFKLEKSLLENENAILSIGAELKDVESKIKETEKWLLLNAVDDKVETELFNAKNNLAKAKTKYTAQETAYNLLVNESSNKKQKLGNINKSLAEMNFDSRIAEEKLVRLQTLEKELRSKKGSLELEKEKMSQITKSLKKLTVVPCGDQYTDCHFIKDAHADKAKSASQEALLLSLVKETELTEKEMLDLASEKIKEQITTYNNLVNQKEILESWLSQQSSRDENEKSTLVILQERCQEFEALVETLTRAVQNTSLLEFKGRRELANNLNSRKSVLEKERSERLIVIGTTKANIERMKETKASFIQAVEDFKVYDTVFQALSKNGIPAIVLKTQLPAINLAIDKILAGVVDFKVYLETEVSSNTLDVFIEDKNKRVIELGSGMEKMIASLALRAALIGLTNLPKPDMFIIDEGFGALDEEGIQKCMRLLNSLKSQFKTVLVISHIPHIKEIADRIIEITTEETSKVSI